MMGHKIRFKGVIWKIIPKLSLLPLLIWSTELCTGFFCFEKIFTVFDWPTDKFIAATEVKTGTNRYKTDRKKYFEISLV